MPMRPLKTSQDHIACAHWRSWPPMKALDAPDQKGVDLYREGTLDGVELQRFQVWERDCGLLRMDESKCNTCKHVRDVVAKPPAVPLLVSKDGSIRTPIVDKTFASALGKFRSGLRAVQRPDGGMHSKKDAAWTKKVNDA